MLRGNQGPSCLAIYLAAAGNQSHREGKEMIQPRQAQERVRGKLGREYVQRRTDSAVQVNKSGILVPCKLRQTQKIQRGADQNPTV